MTQRSPCNDLIPVRRYVVGARHIGKVEHGAGTIAPDVLESPEGAATIERVRAQVAELTKRFPVYR